MQTARASDLQPAISMLEKTPGLLETLLGDAPEELSQWKPAADRWSISEVLAHLADLELLYSERVRCILAEDAPALRPYDQDVASAAGVYSGGSAAEYLASFTALRRATVALLKSAGSSVGERTGRHEELGIVTLSQMLNELASHDLGHLRQIAELYRAHAFHPYAGPFQKYSNPQP
jgi:hypothetical protein